MSFLGNSKAKQKKTMAVQFCEWKSTSNHEWARRSFNNWMQWMAQREEIWMKRILVESNYNKTARSLQVHLSNTVWRANTTRQSRGGLFSWWSRNDPAMILEVFCFLGQSVIHSFAHSFIDSFTFTILQLFVSFFEIISFLFHYKWIFCKIFFLGLWI